MDVAACTAANRRLLADFFESLDESRPAASTGSRCARATRTGRGVRLRGRRCPGPSEALAMALSGRAIALADLDGPGVATLRDRVGRAG